MAAIFDLLLTRMWDGFSIRIICFVDPENVRVAVVISLLTGLEVELNIFGEILDSH